ncbi:MAG: repeat protein [Clostridiales bacterium]|nr:repeat protein [Clostridiales bacterium]
MRKTNRLIILIVTCLIAIILPSCRIKDRAVSNEDNSINLFPASIYENSQEKWGYINREGVFVIMPTFTKTEDFEDNGLALVWDNDKLGIIDRDGKLIIQEKFDYIYPFSEGIAIADNESGFKAINEKGQIIFEANSFIGSFRDGIALFSQESTDGKYLYGYIDKLGKIIIQPKYENAENFINGKAVVKLGEGNYELIDKTGKTLTSLKYYYVASMGEGLITFREKSEDKVGYIDENGEVIIPPSFDYADAFKNGMAIVSMNNEKPDAKYGLINNKGEYIIKPEYNEIKDLGEGMFALGIPLDSDWTYSGSKYAIANSNGEILTDFIYYGVSNFKDGLASANDRVSTFFITNEGKKSDIIKGVEGIGELVFFEDVIKASIDDGLYYMDKQGEVLWRASSNYNIAQEISINEIKFRPNRNVLIYYPEILGLSDKNIQEEINSKLKESFVFGEFYSIRTEDDLDYNFQTDFTIKYYNKDLLNIEKTGYNYPFGAIHGMPIKSYSHINLKSGKLYSLKDLFKSDMDYKERIDNIIKNKINTRPDDYFPEAFRGINEEQTFIITKDSLYIYFAPYEIASYAAGFPEFEIPYQDIMDIIDTDGELWSSFN